MYIQNQSTVQSTDLTTQIEGQIIDLIIIDRDMITDLTVRIDLIIIMGMDTVDLTIMADQMGTALDREMEMIMVVVLIDRVEIEIKLKKSNQLVAFFND
jgi:hypothetical protein